MKQLLDRPEGKVLLGAVVVALIAIFAGVFYVFGGNGARSPNTGAVTAPTLAPTGSGTIFTIDSSNSEASFTIDEVHNGQPTTVVGKTSQVAGQIQVDKSDPSKSQVGQIKVDLTGLKTDDFLRNNAIQGRILETG
ncbi:MAG TPA: YceI family protein, partial [Ktedonobacterales bacterium]